MRDAAAREHLRALGAHEVLAPDEFAGRGPYDVVLELVGAPNLRENIDALAVAGRIVVIGVPAGDEATIPLRSLMAKRATLRASRLRTRSLEEKTATARTGASRTAPHRRGHRPGPGAGDVRPRRCGAGIRALRRSREGGQGWAHDGQLIISTNSFASSSDARDRVVTAGEVLRGPRRVSWYLAIAVVSLGLLR